MKLASKGMNIEARRPGRLAVALFAVAPLISILAGNAHAKTGNLAAVAAVQIALSPEDVKARVATAFGKVKEKTGDFDSALMEKGVSAVASGEPTCERELVPNGRKGCGIEIKKRITSYGFSGDKKFLKLALGSLRDALGGIENLEVVIEDGGVIVRHIPPKVENWGDATVDDPVVAQNTEKTQ